MITFLIGEDPYEDNLKRKSIFFAVLLKLNFGVPGRSTMWRDCTGRVCIQYSVLVHQCSGIVNLDLKAFLTSI